MYIVTMYVNVHIWLEADHGLIVISSFFFLDSCSLFLLSQLFLLSCFFFLLSCFPFLLSWFSFFLLIVFFFSSSCGQQRVGAASALLRLLVNSNLYGALLCVEPWCVLSSVVFWPAVQRRCLYRPRFTSPYVNARHNCDLTVTHTLPAKVFSQPRRTLDSIWQGSIEGGLFLDPACMVQGYRQSGVLSMFTCGTFMLLFTSCVSVIVMCSV